MTFGFSLGLGKSLMELLVLGLCGAKTCVGGHELSFFGLFLILGLGL